MYIHHALWVLLWILTDYGQSVTVKGKMCELHPNVRQIFNIEMFHTTQHNNSLIYLQ